MVAFLKPSARNIVADMFYEGVLTTTGREELCRESLENSRVEGYVYSARICCLVYDPDL
jgi:hypothetical protein